MGEKYTILNVEFPIEYKFYIVRIMLFVCLSVFVFSLFNIQKSTNDLIIIEQEYINQDNIFNTIPYDSIYQEEQVFYTDALRDIVISIINIIISLFVATLIIIKNGLLQDRKND